MKLIKKWVKNTKMMGKKKLTIKTKLVMRKIKIMKMPTIKKMKRTKIWMIFFFFYIQQKHIHLFLKQNQAMLSWQLTNMQKHFFLWIQVLNLYSFSQYAKAHVPIETTWDKMLIASIDEFENAKLLIHWSFELFAIL